MKKIALMAAALFALATVAFAKAPKVSGWKDVAKIANKNGLEVVNDNVEYYVAKGNGGKDFAVYGVWAYSDATVYFSMSSIKGEVFSSAKLVYKGGEFPGESYAMGETDRKCVHDFGPTDATITDLGLLIGTADLMNQRQKVRAQVAGEFGLVLPDSVKKGDANFKKAYDAASDSDFDSEASVKQIINSYFGN